MKTKAVQKPAAARPFSTKRGMGSHCILSRPISRLPPCPPDPGTLRRILIIKTSSIGDVAQALPVACALKRRYPGARITWTVEDWVAPLIQDHPAIDRVVIFPRFARSVQPSLRQWLQKLREGAWSLRSESYDVSLDLQGLLKSAMVAALAHATVRLGIEGQREGAHFVSAAVPRPAGLRHAVDEYLDAARFLGADTSRAEFGLKADPPAAGKVAALLVEAGAASDRPMIVLNPSSSARRKSWPIANWIELIGALDRSSTLVIIGGVENRERHGQIMRSARNGVIDFTGRLTLRELVALLARCSVHVAADTGSAHIAAALGPPVVGIYGPTSPARLSPYGQRDLVVRGEMPCGRTCPRVCMHRRQCLRSITPRAVLEKIGIALNTDHAAAPGMRAQGRGALSDSAS